MAVRHDLVEADNTRPDDPKDKIDKEKDDAAYWDNKAKGERSKREYEDEQRAARLAREREGEHPEPLFQVKGEVDFGKVDVQAQQKELRDTLAKIQEDSKKEIAALNEKNEHYRDKANDIRLEMIEKSNTAQMEALRRTIEASKSNTNTKSLPDQIAEVQALVTTLGYKQNDGGGLSEEVTIALKKMDIDNAQAQRDFEQGKIKDERTWQLAVKEMEQKQVQFAATIASEKEKRGMFAALPEALGSAIGRAMLEGGGGEQESPVAAQPKKKRSKQKLEADKGESGTVGCPECEGPIAIAPDAAQAVCPHCDVTFNIERTEVGSEPG